jgi:DNA mismatch repair protein MutL
MQFKANGPTMAATAHQSGEQSSSSLAAGPTAPVRIWSTNPYRSASDAPIAVPGISIPKPLPQQEASGSTSGPADGMTAPAWRFVGLAHGSYALFETAAGLVLLDRRAAHERVWFERLKEQFRAGAVPSQRLLLPVPMELDPIAASLLLDRLMFLNGHGFEIAEFGRNFYRVEAVPAWMEPADAEPFLRNLLGAFREGRWPDGNPELAREELARLAAAKAIRLPQSVGDAELRLLVSQLFATRTPLTSPSGRPTYIELNHGELARRFQK